jgi:hypothetical protein
MHVRAIQFMGLNAVRALSLVSLILVFSSTILVMVINIKAVNAFEADQGNSTMVDCDYIEGSSVPNQPAGVFWAVVASLLIICQTIILGLSEVGWPMAFFDRYFPVLGSDFGLGALGIFQGLISTQILSHHVDDFTLVSAFFLFSLGCLNMLLGLIFRESAKAKRSISSWRAEVKGVLPTSQDNRPVFVNNNSTSAAFSEKAPYVMRQDTAASDKGSLRSTEKAGYGFGRQGEKSAALRGFILQKPSESLPRYMTPPPASTRSANLARNHTSVSSTSSFYSPHEGATSPNGDRYHHERGESPPPTFRSSPNAI